VSMTPSITTVIMFTMFFILSFHFVPGLSKELRNISNRVIEMLKVEIIGEFFKAVSYVRIQCQ
jgi:hypothetical protein